MDYTPNKSQKAYIDESINANTRLIAPAGCGKTITLLKRAERVIDELKARGIDNPRILIVTFTNAARIELERKMAESKYSTEYYTIRTLNKLGAESIRFYSDAEKIQFVDDSDSSKIRLWYQKTCRDYLETSHREKYPNFLQSLQENNISESERNSMLFSFFERVKETGIDLEKTVNLNSFVDGIDELERKNRIDKNYYIKPILDFESDSVKKKLNPYLNKEINQKLLSEMVNLFNEATTDLYSRKYASVFSLTDQKYMLLYKLRNDEAPWFDKFDHVFVDEFQDINALDLALVNEIVRYSDTNERRCFLSVVGDPDQAIFEWRGSSPKYIKKPESFFDGKIFIRHRLNINYRMPQNIVGFSQNLIKYNHKKELKPLEAFLKYDASIERLLDESSPVVISEAIIKRIDEFLDEGKSIAILGRKRNQLIIPQLQLLKHGVPFIADSEINLAQSKSFRCILGMLESHEKGLSCKSCTKETLDSFFNFANMFSFFPWAKKDEDTVRTQIASEFPIVCSITDIMDFCDKCLKNIRRDIESLIEAIKRFMDETMVFIALEILQENYEGLRKASFGNDNGDLFRVEPPFPLMIEFAADYGEDFNGFVHVLKQAIEQSEKLNEESDAFEIKQKTVYMMTAHKSKGREFDSVIILDAIENIWPCKLKEQVDAEVNIPEERRLFYVAMTRAKKDLIVTVPKIYGGVSTQKSRFIKESGIGDLEVN